MVAHSFTTNVTHVVTFKNARKMTSQQCVVAGDDSTKNHHVYYYNNTLWILFTIFHSIIIFQGLRKTMIASWFGEKAAAAQWQT